jgi:hypothetical protein
MAFSNYSQDNFCIGNVDGYVSLLVCETCKVQPEPKTKKKK